MSVKRLVIICSLPSFLVGCAEFYGSQPPAPMYGGQLPASREPKKAESQSVSPKETAETQALKEFSDIKPEPLLPLVPTPLETPVPPSPTSAIPPPTLSMPTLATPQPPAIPVPTLGAQLPTLPKPVPGTQTPPLVAPAPVVPQSALPSPPQKLTPFEPIETTARLSPAVGALVSAANQNTQAGNLELAAASIERAIRIEPRNATLFYKLALVRLKQSKPRLAEDLAKKSALLASTDNFLKKHCWLLIAHAREKQQNFTGAKEAAQKADSF